MNTIRIAEISFNLECGGIQNMVANLSIGLSELGHQVDVLCLNRPTGSTHERRCLEILSQHGIPVRFLGRKPRRLGLAALATLYRLVSTGTYDVLHSHWPLMDALRAC